MAASKQTETGTPTPEQLLLLLEAQLAAQRGKRNGRGHKRSVYLAVAIIFIIGVGAVALMIAQQMMLDLHERGMQSGTASVVESQ